MKTQVVSWLKAPALDRSFGGIRLKAFVEKLFVYEDTYQGTTSEAAEKLSLDVKTCQGTDS